MNKYRNSTKERPLLFFESFLKKKKFDKYENDFYSNAINPSFKANKNKGYIEYIENEYVNREIEPNRVYFIDRLKIVFKNQIEISIELMNVWMEEHLNRNVNVENYILNQRTKILTLKKTLQFQIEVNDLVVKFLDAIEEFLLNFNNNNNNNRIENPTEPAIPTISYFGLNQNIKTSHIRELFQISCELLLIDPEVVLYGAFNKVFTCVTPSDCEEKIIFNADNQIVAYYFKCLQPFFRNLRHTKIVKSDLFLNKKKEPFSLGSLDTALTYSKKKPKNDLELIQSEINNLFLDNS